MIHRRSVLKGAALTVVAAGAGPIAFFSGPVHAAGPGYQRSDFEPLVDRGFYVDGSAHPRLELVAVTDGPQAPQLEQFTLVFRGDADLELEDAIHDLLPEGGSPLALHLAPAGADADGRYYQAAFALTSFHGGRGCAGAASG